MRYEERKRLMMQLERDFVWFCSALTAAGLVMLAYAVWRWFV